MKSLNNYGVFDLTPVEDHGGILFKRDDKFMPFDDVPLSGGKVRQAITLIHDNYEHIKNECNGTVATATSVHSPQGLIVARTAKEFGFRSKIIIGATTDDKWQSNRLIRKCVEFGATIDYESKFGYDSVLAKRLTVLNQTERFFTIKFGINLLDNPSAIIGSIGYQTQNIPDDLDVLVIPTGSGITAGGILRGLIQYNIKPKRIIVHQIAGFDRTKTIGQVLAGHEIDFEYVADKTYSYSRKLKIQFNDVAYKFKDSTFRGEFLDPIYESKSFEWMHRNIDTIGNRVLFWIVGNSLFVR